jgi:hypothetical protein
MDIDIIVEHEEVKRCLEFAVTYTLPNWNCKYKVFYWHGPSPLIEL